MFFKNVDSWDRAKLRTTWLVLNILYFIAVLLIPIIIVGCRYTIFEHVSKYKLTGWGIILVIIISVVAVRTLNKAINKLPESTLGEQRLKYTLLGVKALIIPILILVVLYLFKKNFDLAYSTIWYCLISYIVGVFIDYGFIQYLDQEIELRKKAKEKIEIDKRVENMKK